VACRLFERRLLFLLTKCKLIPICLVQGTDSLLSLLICLEVAKQVEYASSAKSYGKLPISPYPINLQLPFAYLEFFALYH
jgi:hypothetical protein